MSSKQDRHEKCDECVHAWVCDQTRQRTRDEGVCALVTWDVHRQTETHSGYNEYITETIPLDRTMTIEQACEKIASSKIAGDGCVVGRHVELLFEQRE